MKQYLKLNYNYVLKYNFSVQAASQELFDEFFRRILYGKDENNPKPKIFKLTRSQMFSEKEILFEYYYEKKPNGNWQPWLEYLDKAMFNIPATAKVRYFFINNYIQCA